MFPTVLRKPSRKCEPDLKPHLIVAFVLPHAVSQRRNSKHSFRNPVRTSRVEKELRMSIKRTSFAEAEWNRNNNSAAK